MGNSVQKVIQQKSPHDGTTNPHHNMSVWRGKYSARIFPAREVLSGEIFQKSCVKSKRALLCLFGESDVKYDSKVL